MEILYIAAFLLPFIMFYWIWPSSKSQASALNWGRKVTAFLLFTPSLAYFPRYFGKQGSEATDAFVTWAGTSLVLGIFGIVLGAGTFWLAAAVRRIRSGIPLAVESAKNYAPTASANLKKSTELMADSLKAVAQNLSERHAAGPQRSGMETDVRDVSIFRSVAREIESGVKDEGLWAIAVSSADGDETVAQARYIRLRVDQIKALRGSDKNIDSA